MKKIIVTTAYMDCCMCPAIITGTTDDGWTIYARYRWGMLSVRIDPRDPPPDGGASGRWIMDKQIDPEELDGWMDYDDLKMHTAEIVEWPDELTRKIYEEDESIWLGLLD